MRPWSCGAHERLVFDVRMIRFPLLHFDAQPEAIDAGRDDGKEQPLDPAAEELDCLAVKGEAMAVDDGMHGFPAEHMTDRPGIREPGGQDGDKDTTEAMAEKAE